MRPITMLFHHSCKQITRVRVFTFPICPFVEAIRIGALEARIDLHETLVNIRENADTEGAIATWPQHYLGHRGRLTTPTMVLDLDNGQQLLCHDTISILRMFTDPKSEVKHFVSAKQSAAAELEPLHPELMMLKPGGAFYEIMSSLYVATATANIDQVESASVIADKLLPALNSFESHMAKREASASQFYSSDNLGLVDFFAAPQFARLAELAKNYEIETLDPALHPTLCAYSQALLTRRSVATILGPKTEFSGLLNDLYAYRKTYLAPIGVKNGVIRVSAVGMTQETEDDEAVNLAASALGNPKPTNCFRR